MCRKTNAEHVYEMRIKSTWKLGHKFAGKSTHVIRVISLAMRTHKKSLTLQYIYSLNMSSRRPRSAPPPPKSQMLSAVIGPYVRVFCILRQLQLHLDGTRWRQSLFTLRLRGPGRFERPLLFARSLVKIKPNNSRRHTGNAAANLQHKKHTHTHTI